MTKKKEKWPERPIFGPSRARERQFKLPMLRVMRTMSRLHPIAAVYPKPQDLTVKLTAGKIAA
jgi:hypothetical protein